MSAKTATDKKRAKEARRNRHKRRTRAAAARKRAEKWRLKNQRRPSTEDAPSPWPDVTGLTEEEAARVWEEHFFWEDYDERNS